MRTNIEIDEKLMNDALRLTLGLKRSLAIEEKGSNRRPKTCSRECCGEKSLAMETKAKRKRAHGLQAKTSGTSSWRHSPVLEPSRYPGHFTKCWCANCFVMGGFAIAAPICSSVSHSLQIVLSCSAPASSGGQYF